MAVSVPAARSPRWSISRATSCAKAPSHRSRCWRRSRVHEPWQVLSSSVAFDSPWFRIRQDRVRLPSGVELDDYYVLEQFDFLKVFAYTDDGQGVFVRQYKHGIRDVILELPAAFVHDSTRTPTIEHVYLGQVTAVGEPQPEETEDIEVVLIPLAEVPARIAGGEIVAMSTIAAALYCLPLIGN